LTSVRIEGDAQLSVGGAVGMAMYPADADSVDGLIAFADADMYERKAAARQPRLV
jgi:predicted signal transduction protein with EAL and GGDEF domain